MCQIKSLFFLRIFGAFFVRKKQECEHWAIKIALASKNTSNESKLLVEILLPVSTLI